jgi:hypothetical protein
MGHIMARRSLRQEVYTLRSRLGEQLRLEELVGRWSARVRVASRSIAASAKKRSVFVEVAFIVEPPLSPSASPRHSRVRAGLHPLSEPPTAFATTAVSSWRSVGLQA